MYEFGEGGAELQKVGILVSRIPDIFGRKSGHFQKVATNFRIFGIKRIKYGIFKTHINSKWIEINKKQAYASFYASYCDKTCQIHNSDIFWWKSGYRTKRSLFATLGGGAVRNRYLGNFCTRPASAALTSYHFLSLLWWKPLNVPYWELIYQIRDYWTNKKETKRRPVFGKRYPWRPKTRVNFL